ncbi:MAG: hypothetical protein KDK39_14770 [Leptospiraceae bacterium]|nr:hypothetical protein [Leptospiraceae bacterium]
MTREEEIDEAVLFIRNLFAAVDKGSSIDSSEVDTMMERLVFIDGQLPELDLEYASRLSQFEKIVGHRWEWQYHPRMIMQGTFPLDELPDHVRDILKQKYYQDSCC